MSRVPKAQARSDVRTVDVASELAQTPLLIPYLHDRDSSLDFESALADPEIRSASNAIERYGAD